MRLSHLTVELHSCGQITFKIHSVLPVVTSKPHSCNWFNHGKLFHEQRIISRFDVTATTWRSPLKTFVSTGVQNLGGVRKPRIVNSTNNLMKPCLIFLIIDEESIKPRTGSQIARV